jgi:hypothetical protein
MRLKAILIVLVALYVGFKEPGSLVFLMKPQLSTAK